MTSSIRWPLCLNGLPYSFEHPYDTDLLIKRTKKKGRPLRRPYLKNDLRSCGALFLNHNLHIVTVLILRGRVDRKQLDPATDRAKDHEEHQEHDQHRECDQKGLTLR